MAQEVTSALVPGATSLVTAVGDEVIDRTPAGLREQAIESVGQRDKPLLVMGVLLVPVLLGALLASPCGARGLQLFVGGAGVVSLIGGVAATHSPGGSTAGAAATAGTGFVAAVAALARELSVDSWRLWTYTWMATPGRHVLRVRATDGTGILQPQGERQPFPSGASGWHTIAVSVSN